MESIRDRFNGRDRMGSDRGGRDRYDRMDRGDMGERAPRRGMSYGSEGSQIDDIANVIEQSNSKQLEVFADCIDDVKDEVYASGKEIMKTLDQMASNGFSGRGAARPQESVAPAVDPAMKEEILRAVSNNTDLLLAIQDVLKKEAEEKEKAAAAPATEEAAAAEQTEKEEDPLKAILTQYYNNMEEHVHKENVKCYRNVQAALSEQGTQVVDQSKKSLGILKVFAIVSMVLGVANIALFVSYILGII